MTPEELQEELKILIHKHTGSSWHTSEKASYFLRDFVLKELSKLQFEVAEKDQKILSLTKRIPILEKLIKAKL